MTANRWLTFSFTLGTGGSSGGQNPPVITVPTSGGLEDLDFTYEVRDVLSGQFFGRLQLTNVVFNTPVVGTGSLAATVFVEAGNAERIRHLTNPDQVALYVRTGSVYWFGGPIVARPWTPSGQQLAITALPWKQWLYTKLLGPLLTDPPADQTFAWEDVDQLEIARDIITAATSDIGGPVINLDTTQTSGITRTVNFQGSAFKYAGDFLDDLSQRDGGFDWDIEVHSNVSTGDPELWLGLYYPQRGTGKSIGILKSTETGGNATLSSDGQIDDTAENKRSRVWATGSGSPPDQVMTFDEDTSLSADVALPAVQAESYTSKSAEIATRTTTDPAGGGTELYNILTANDWSTYSVDFGDYPPVSLSIRAASKDGCQVEIRNGSNTGTIIGVLQVPSLGDYKTWATVAANLTTQLTGTQTITLVYKAPSIVVNWFQLNIPDLSARATVLLRETVYNYSDTNDGAVLGQRAIAERDFLAQVRNSMQVTTTLDNPDIRLYGPGDRHRLIVSDDWLDLNFAAVRVLDRELSLGQEDSPPFATLTLDLNDVEEPQVGEDLDESGDGS